MISDLPLTSSQNRVIETRQLALTKMQGLDSKHRPRINPADMYTGDERFDLTTGRPVAPRPNFPR
jgi:hypothetical protein